MLLLNPVLTVEVGRTGSHSDCGWQALTRQIVVHLSERRDPPVFLLWGGKAAVVLGRRQVAAVGGHWSWRPVIRRYDFDRSFMAEGNHFAATAHLVDWWEIGSTP